MSRRLSPALLAAFLFAFGGSQAMADAAASTQPVHAKAASHLQPSAPKVNHLPSALARVLRESRHLRHHSTRGSQPRFNAGIPGSRLAPHSCCTYLGFYLWSYPYYVDLYQGDFFYGPFDYTYYILDFYEAGYGYIHEYFYYIPATGLFYGPYAD